MPGQLLEYAFVVWAEIKSIHWKSNHWNQLTLYPHTVQTCCLLLNQTLICLTSCIVPVVQCTNYRIPNKYRYNGLTKASFFKNLLQHPSPPIPNWETDDQKADITCRFTILPSCNPNKVVKFQGWARMAGSLLPLGVADDSGVGQPRFYSCSGWSPAQFSHLH